MADGGRSPGRRALSAIPERDFDRQLEKSAPWIFYDRDGKYVFPFPAGFDGLGSLKLAAYRVPHVRYYYDAPPYRAPGR